MKRRSTTRALDRLSWGKMAPIVENAISSLGERHGCTKLQILSYIKANNPRLAYPNTHNLVLSLQRAIIEGVLDNSLRERGGKYKLASVAKKHTKLNKLGTDILERSKPAVRASRLLKRPRSLSLTSIGFGSDAASEEPQDRKRRGKSRRKGRGKKRGSKKRRRRSHVSSHAASSPGSVEADPEKAPSNDLQSHTSEKELSNPESADNVSSMDDCNAGSALSGSS